MRRSKSQLRDILRNGEQNINYYPRKEVKFAYKESISLLFDFHSSESFFIYAFKPVENNPVMKKDKEGTQLLSCFPDS